MTSLDRRIIETEEKVQSQILQLASGSFEEDEKPTTTRNMASIDEHQNGEKRRLMSTAGVLLFDGMGTCSMYMLQY